MSFGAAGKLEFSYLEVPCRSLRRAHGKASSFGSLNGHAVKRNDQIIVVFGPALIDERARFSAHHRFVVMDEQVFAIERLSHELDRLVEFHQRPLLCGTSSVADRWRHTVA